jgi:hypothetical protein
VKPVTSVNGVYVGRDPNGRLTLADGRGCELTPENDGPGLFRRFHVGRDRAVYLCGPINGCDDTAARGWRDDVAAELLLCGFRVLDPMDRDYRGIEADNAAAIVAGDLADIAAADVVVVNASRPSWGTAMEVVYAHGGGKAVYAFGAGDRPSPWLRHHCHGLFADAAAVVEHLVNGG